MAKVIKGQRSALSFSRRLGTHLGDRVRTQMKQAKQKRKKALRKMLARCIIPDVSSEMEG